MMDDIEEEMEDLRGLEGLRIADGSIMPKFIIATSVAPPARQRASSSEASNATASSTVVGS